VHDLEAGERHRVTLHELGEQLGRVGGTVERELGEGLEGVPEGELQREAELAVGLAQPVAEEGVVPVGEEGSRGAS
jgi:hypothetical protein